MDLQQLKLSPATYLNIWCDHQADAARQLLTSTPDADVLPIEKWAFFTCYPVTHKIIEKLDKGIQESMYPESILTYIHKKHNICPTKLIQAKFLQHKTCNIPSHNSVGNWPLPKEYVSSCRPLPTVSSHAMEDTFSICFHILLAFFFM